MISTALFKKQSVLKLLEAGYEDAESTMRILLSEKYGISNTRLFAHPEDEFEESEAIRDVKRLLMGEPLGYLLGKTSFYGIEMEVTPAVLIPRQETEELVEWILSDCRDQAFHVLDLCTGSGCILISLLTNSCSYGMGTDVSADALDVAGRNLIRYHLEDRVVLMQGSMFEALDPDARYDVIVSNPPYVTEDEMASLSDRVRHEPSLALNGGADGLDFYRVIAKEAGHYLKENGFLYLEIGYQQGNAVSGLLQKNGWHEIVLRKDLSGRDRMIRARR